jgi:DNA invertase Pin-like site-specific DNA recombinase
MIAAIYARKSTDQSDRADEARSVTRQVEHAKAYAATKGWTGDRLPTRFTAHANAHVSVRPAQGAAFR